MLFISNQFKNRLLLQRYTCKKKLDQAQNKLYRGKTVLVSLGNKSMDLNTLEKYPQKYIREEFNPWKYTPRENPPPPQK